MGEDIHLNIIKTNGEIRYNEIFSGRNYRWFDNLQGCGYDDEYSYLHDACLNFDEITADAALERHYIESKELGYYGFHCVTIGDFIKWAETYKPWIKAGWVNSYDLWRINNKKYVPEEVQTRLTAEDCTADMHFTEYTDWYDCSKWLLEFIKEKADIKESDYIIYYFDC